MVQTNINNATHFIGRVKILCKSNSRFFSYANAVRRVLQYRYYSAPHISQQDIELRLKGLFEGFPQFVNQEKTPLNFSIRKNAEDGSHKMYISSKNKDGGAVTIVEIECYPINSKLILY